MIDTTGPPSARHDPVAEAPSASVGTRAPFWKHPNSSEPAGLINPVTEMSELSSSLDVMLAEQSALRADGRWLSGRPTLLSVIGVHEDEVKLCRALAWLISPDGFHRAGTAFLERFLALVGIEPASLSRDELSGAQVLVEEARFEGNKETRADIVVRVGARMILVEAKIRAGEQNKQADRLARLWANGSPTLVFLTPHAGRLPHTAKQSQGQWLPLTWEQISQSLWPVLAESLEIAPGAKELLTTFKLHGGSTVLDDTKVKFYFQHRHDIDELASLRTLAVRAVIDAFSAATEARLSDDEYPGLSATTNPHAAKESATLPISGVHGVIGVTLDWRHVGASGPAIQGPTLALLTDRSDRKTYADIREKTKPSAMAHGLTKEGLQYIWRGEVSLPAEFGNVDEYAMSVLARLRDTWAALSTQLAD